MKFYVTRTSDWGGDEQPCEGATLLNPDFKEKEQFALWGIEFETLKELLAFERENGRIIIKQAADDRLKYSKFEIEIYDDYRE